MGQDIYKQHIVVLRSKMYGISLKYLGNSDDAEDVVQEILLKLWRKKELLSTLDNPEAYVITMVKNRCLDILKSNKKFQHIELSDIVNSKDNPDDEVGNKDANLIIEKIIQSLPELQQLIITMRDIEDYNTKEIADITQTSEVAVRVNLSRARKKVREIYLSYLNYESSTK